VLVQKLVLVAGVLFSARAFATDGAWEFPADNLDPTVSPADDFYEHAVGGWRKHHPIPADRDRWGTFDVVQERTEDRIRRILEDAASAHAPVGSDLQKIGDFYTSGLDLAAIEAAGTTPIDPELARIGNVTSLDELQTEIAELQSIGVDVAFDFGAMPDPMDSTRNLGVADEGGLGLPDRSYYFPSDEDAAARLRDYTAHVAKTLALAGEAPDDARADADRVVRLETTLAGGTMSRVERRDPHAIYHPTGLDGLAALTPLLSWTRYFDLLGLHGIERINVTSPRFFRTLDGLLAATPMADWRAYLRWHLLDATSAYLPAAFADESYAFSARLSGTTAPPPRWLRVLRATNAALGFAVGKIYVERHFSADSRARVAAILEEIQAALAASISTLSWMGPETRERALEKLHLMIDRVGYPDRWRDYSALEVNQGPYVLNGLRAAAFEVRRQLEKIGQPVDREEWEMTPQTVNAYYNPALNEIVFPAGILQPPFFDEGAPATWNHGAVGAVIGHEITHGFDDQGARYDGHGNLENWWTDADYARFLARTSCITRQYAGYTVVGGGHVNGGLVTGEATADLGGVELSLRALAASPGGRAESGQILGGFPADQLFYLAFASIWATNIRPEAEATRTVVDPHPPARYRVNGTLANIPEFQAAFAIPSESPMVAEPRCTLWE
jgi:putative endopeptidase